MSEEQSPGTFPLVFESGVVNLDEDGTLHIHLSHSESSPHPVVTHPEGSESTIPGDASEAHLTGDDSSPIRLRCGFREAETLPEGFVFHIKGWKMFQLEMSGDLTVVLTGIDAPPPWFQAGKIHRFDGPEEGVRLYKGSQPIVETKQTGTAPPPRGRPTPPPPVAEYQPDRSLGEDAKLQDGSGCGAVLLLAALSGAATALLPSLV